MEKSWNMPVPQRMQRHSGGWKMNHVISPSLADAPVPEAAGAKREVIAIVTTAEPDLALPADR